MNAIYVISELKVKTSIGNAPISKKINGSSYYQSCERICFEYYMTITILTGNRPLIDIFGKLVYLYAVERYKCTCRARVCSPIYIFMCTVLLTL